jgi:ElaB/YqjD/DUF883 family membrane-anchored ribosome-binding protein
MAVSKEDYVNQTSDAEQRIRAAGARIGDKASEYASKASDQFENAVQSAESTARSVAEQGREAGERVQQVAGNMKSAIDKSVHDQPMVTLGVAAALGFVLGALWKS